MHLLGTSAYDRPIEDVTRLEIRVGLVHAVQDHPEADKWVVVVVVALHVGQAGRKKNSYICKAQIEIVHTSPPTSDYTAKKLILVKLDLGKLYLVWKNIYLENPLKDKKCWYYATWRKKSSEEFHHMAWFYVVRSKEPMERRKSNWCNRLKTQMYVASLIAFRHNMLCICIEWLAIPNSSRCHCYFLRVDP